MQRNKCNQYISNYKNKLHLFFRVNENVLCNSLLYAAKHLLDKYSSINVKLLLQIYNKYFFT